MSLVEDDYMLTTFDNPINPFEDFVGWWKQDLLLGHNCCGILAKEAICSDSFSDEKNEKEIDRAMNKIISENPTLFRKVLPSDYKKSRKNELIEV